MEDLTPRTEATHVVARRFAHRLLDLAAEMRVDGVAEADCVSIEANAGNLLVEAVKAQRRVEGVDGMTDPVMQILRAAAPLIPPSWPPVSHTAYLLDADGPYKATGEIINGVETATGRWACCGAQAYVSDLYEGFTITNEHNDFCPRMAKAGDSDSLRSPAQSVTWTYHAQDGPL